MQQNKLMMLGYNIKFIYFSLKNAVCSHLSKKKKNIIRILSCMLSMFYFDSVPPDH